MLDRGVMGVRRADLVAIGRRPFAFVVLADSACAIYVQIKDRGRIYVGFFDRVRDREGDFNVFQIQESSDQRIAILGRLFKGDGRVFGSPRLRDAQGRRRAYAIGQDVGGLRIFITNSYFQVGEGYLRRIRVGFICVFASGLGRVQVTLRFSVDDENGDICFISSAFVIQDRCLHAIVPMYFMAVVFLQIIEDDRSSATLTARIASDGERFKDEARVIRRVCFSAINERGVNENLHGRATIIATIVAGRGEGLQRVFGVLLRVVEGALYDNACHVSIRAITACTRSATWAANAGFRIFMRYFCWFNFVVIFRRSLRFDLDFDVMYQNRPFFNFFDSLFGGFLVFRFSCYLLIGRLLLSVS